MDILEAMKDALMKYETIDAKQIDDLMDRKEVRQPADWDDTNKPSNNDKPTGGSEVKVEEKSTKDADVPKPNVGKPGDLPS
jgi:cell division protease FtsH